MQDEHHQDTTCAVGAHRQAEEKPRFAPPPRRRENPAKPQEREAGHATGGSGNIGEVAATEVAAEGATKTVQAHQDGTMSGNEVAEAGARDAIRDSSKLSTDGPEGPERGVAAPAGSKTGAAASLAAPVTREDGRKQSKGIKKKSHGSSGRARAQSADNQSQKAAEARATAGAEAEGGLGPVSAPPTARDAAGADEHQEGSQEEELTELVQTQGQEPSQEAAVAGERSDQVTSDQEWEQAIVDLEREREASEEAAPIEGSNTEGHMAREHSGQQDDIEAGDDGTRAGKSMSMRSVTSDLSTLSRSSKISQALAGFSGRTTKRRSSLKEPSPFELSMKAEKVARVFRFLVHGNGHEVRLRHRRAVWELLLDDAVIGNVIHDSGTAITREQHIIDFAVPSAGLSEPIMACARMMWIVPKFRWSYRLLVNGIEVPACYRALMGEIAGISPPEVASPITAGQPRFMSRLHGRRWTS